MPLSDIKARNATPGKHFDGGGLYLLVKADDGGKYWRLKYRFGGKEKLLAIGVYGNGTNGTITLAQARTERDAAKKTLREGRDPSAEKKERRQQAHLLGERTFEAVARQWLKPANRPPKAKKWTAEHAARVQQSLEDDVFPYLGAKPIHEMTAPQILAVLRKVQDRGAIETAQRILQRIAGVFSWAMAHGLTSKNPATDAELTRQLAAPDRKHRAALKANDLPEFFERLKAYDGSPITRLALRLQVLTFVRPGELRAAEWSEFDWDADQWTIPAERMKMRVPHIVPLSRQALAVLEELRAITGKGNYLFPNDRKIGAYMSENTTLFALYRMGYHGRATGHGFRSTASTILNEARRKRGHDSVRMWDKDAIERQLAHQERDKVRGAYNFAEYLEERTAMLQWYADYLEAASSGGKVTPIRKSA